MKLPRATRALITAAVVGGVLTVLVAGWHKSAWSVTTSQLAVAAVMSVLVVGTWVWPILVFRGGEYEAFHMDETFFVVLALVEPPAVTLAALGVATVVAQLIRRRPIVKSSFNSGQQLIAAGLGLASSRHPRLPFPWPRLLP
jgi:hypothetical protein